MKPDNNYIRNPVKFFNRRFVLLILFTGLFQYCTSEKEKGLPDPLSIQLIAHDVTTFLGTDGSIEIEVSGGVSPYSYDWSNGAITKDIDGLTAGFYSVIVKDAVDSTATGSVMINQPIPENVIMDIGGNYYTSVKIGEQTWMQQNLRVSLAPDSTPITSYVYNNEPENAKTYGRLYPWDVLMNGSTQEKAQGICPAGWHVPSDGEWKILEMELGMTQAEADISNSWRGQGVGTKLRKGGESGYEALYSGRYIGFFDLLNQYEYIWTSTEYGTDARRRSSRAGPTGIGGKGKAR